MNELHYVLLSDGSSDRALLNVLDWLLRKYLFNCAIQGEWADLRQLHRPIRTLVERIEWSLRLYPCDLLFIHRDAEALSYELRSAEIQQAVLECADSIAIPSICVVPVRMMEAWLLLDERALRQAAGNPRGRKPLNIPSAANLEQIPDPKSVLHKCLRMASGLTGRRLKKFRIQNRVQRLAQLIDDFSPLRALPAFSALETDIKETIQSQAWNCESKS